MLLLFYITLFYISFLNLRIRNKSINITLILIMLLFSAFRKDIGTDFDQYLNIQLLSYQSIDYVYFEPIHKLFYAIGNILEYDYTYFILSSIFIFIFLLKILKDYSYISFEITFLFLCSGFYFYSFNGIRQFMAIIVVLYSIKYIKAKSKKYYLYVLLATLTHYSAITFMVVPYILKILKKIQKKSFYYVFLVVGLLGGSLITSLFGLIIRYIPILNVYESYFYINRFDFTIKHLLERVLLLIVIVIIIKITDVKKWNNIFYIFIVGVFLRFVLPVDLARYALYFTMFEILLFGQLLRDRNNKSILIKITIIGYLTIKYAMFLLTNTSSILGG